MLRLEVARPSGVRVRGVPRADPFDSAVAMMGRAARERQARVALWTCRRAEWESRLSGNKGRSSPALGHCDRVRCSELRWRCPDPRDRDPTLQIHGHGPQNTESWVAA